MKNIKKICLLCAICFLICSIFVCCVPASSAYAYCDNGHSIFDVLLDKKSTQTIEQVYLGGYPLGITLDGKGVTVVGLNEFVCSSGSICCPALECGLQIGDVIVKLDEKDIYNSATLSEIASSSDGKALSIEYVRQGVELVGKIVPVKDFATNNYRLGLWTKDVSSGVGTMTYVKKDLTFGCLGHPIADNKGKIVEASDGGVYKCQINDVLPGKRGQAGELHGSFDFNDKIGSIYANNKFGAFGKLDELPYDMDLVDVVPHDKVKMGKAQILSTVDGTTRQLYDIEIVKTCNQSCPDDKSMVIRVIDKDLISKTGGIVQGMSGSPIIQDGKLVGAVTHVFVNDSTKGYGIYAEWMLAN